MKLGKLCFIALFLLLGTLTVIGQTPEREPEKIPQDRITIHELKRKIDKGEKLLIIDARAGSSYIGSTVRIKGALHITLDQLETRMSELPKDQEIITYCT